MNARLKEIIENDPFEAMMAEWMENIDPSKQVDGDYYAFISTSGWKGVNFEKWVVLPGSYLVKGVKDGRKYFHLYSPCLFKTNEGSSGIQRPFYYDYGYFYAWLTLNEEYQKSQPIYNELKRELERIHPEAFHDLEYGLKVIRPYIKKIKEQDETIDLINKTSEALSQTLEKERENPDLNKAYCIMATKYMDAMHKKNSKKRECVKEALSDLKTICNLKDIPEELLNSLDSYDDEGGTSMRDNNGIVAGGNVGVNISKDGEKRLIEGMIDNQKKLN